MKFFATRLIHFVQTNSSSMEDNDTYHQRNFHPQISKQGKFIMQYLIFGTFIAIKLIKQIQEKPKITKMSFEKTT